MKLKGMTDTEPKPVSPNMDNAAATARVIILVISAITALVGFAATRDLAGFIAYVKTTDGLAFIALLSTAVTFLWGQIKTRKRAKQVQETQQP